MLLALLLTLLPLPSACDAPVASSGPTACEVRTLVLPATGALSIANDVTGGVEVVGWDRDDVAVTAVVRAYASRGRTPEALLDATRIETDGTLRPVTDGGGWVDVQFVVSVPRSTDLDVTTRNGALHVEGVQGTLRLTTRNGTVTLDAVAGDVEARTQNGAVTVALDGPTWAGAGLAVETRNGDVRLVVPETYSALVEAETGYGAIGARLDGFRPARETARLYLGEGGATLRLLTGQGDVHLVRD